MGSCYSEVKNADAKYKVDLAQKEKTKEGENKRKKQGIANTDVRWLGQLKEIIVGFSKSSLISMPQCPSGRLKNDWRLITIELNSIGLSIFLIGCG